MQNRGAIKFFAVALALVSIYQLSFTYVARNVRTDAAEYAKQFEAQADKLFGNDIMERSAFLASKENAYLDSIREEKVYNLLVKKYTYRECEEREINLGLDLKGGMNVTLEISTVEIIKSMAGMTATDATFVATINKAKQMQADSQDDFVTLFGKAFEEVAGKDAQLAQYFYANPELKSLGINFNSTNAEILEIVHQQTQAAIDNSFNVLRTRIDRFGVSQPNIQRIGLESSGRILVELPGIKDPLRVRKLLQGSAKLEFWETFDNSEVFQYLQEANTQLATVLERENESQSPTDETPIVEDSTASESSLLDNLIDSTSQESVLDNLDVDSTTTNTAAGQDDWKKQNPLFSILYPAVSSDGQLNRGAAVGYASGSDTATVSMYLAKVSNIFPRELKLMWEYKTISDANGKPLNLFNLIAIKDKDKDGKAPLSGDVITNAREQFGEFSGEAKVSMTMNSEGSRTWARLTKENVGKQVAVVLDNFVYSYPVVNSEIKGGSSEISGNFTLTEAKDLANILKSGKMDAPAQIIQEEVVGPTLGKQSVKSGMFSFLIAFVIVLLYMAFYYNRAGLAADFALIANLFFIFGVLSSLQAVLTMPGIAGIVLTIGMSVDANVLIFERVREELRQGKGLKLAVSDGFKNAYSAIIDANVTTLVTGIILYVFGTGPIKGFATTLIIGVLTSLFAAIFLTRLVFLWHLDRNKDISFDSKITRNWFKDVAFPFLEKRKIMYVISAIVILAGIVSLFTRGLNQGVDFTGGRTYVVAFDQNVTIDDVKNNLAAQFDGRSPDVVTFGGSHQVKITTKYKIDEQGTGVDNEIESKLYAGLTPMLGDGVSADEFKKDFIQSSHLVGPTIADDIKVSAVWSIMLSLVFIFIYIFIRFHDWRFGLGAIVSLAHDVLFVIGIFSMFYGILPFSLEIDQAFIAAILTVIGYSINDTVIIFDRIREYLGLHRRQDDINLYNQALNSTLGRTFSTSFSTLIVLLAIFVFGGEVIRGFIFAILLGVGVGTYSSLFIATPVVYDTQRKIQAQVEKIKSKRKTSTKPAAEVD